MLPHDIYLIGYVGTPGDICLIFDIYFKSKIESNFKPLYSEGFIKSYLFLDTKFIECLMIACHLFNILC